MLPSSIRARSPSRLVAWKSGAIPASLPSEWRAVTTYSSPCGHSPPPSVCHQADRYSWRKNGTWLALSASSSFHSPARALNSGSVRITVKFMDTPVFNRGYKIEPLRTLRTQRNLEGFPFQVFLCAHFESFVSFVVKSCISVHLRLWFLSAYSAHNLHFTSIILPDG